MVYLQPPDWDRPWQSERILRSSGSGFIIEGNRIMTNAHVVAWAKEIMVRRFQDSRLYPAKVSYVGRDCDLAILTVEAQGFFDGIEPLTLGELPEVRSTVFTFGYPAGGQQISYTSGVVSRIEIQTYTYPGDRRLLAIQTDAAINPGNSGGPVIQNDRVVGVAFQGIPGLENTGFFIPPPVVEHFLEDIADGSYEGCPISGIDLESLHNPAQRNYLGLTSKTGGARIGQLLTKSVQDHLRTDDVLLQIDQWPVARDASVLYEGNQVHAELIVSLAQNGDTIPLKIWREDQEISVDLPVFADRSREFAGNLYRAPRYYIYGGLVFTPLSRNYLSSAFGSNASSQLVYELFHRWRTEPETTRTEPIMLANVLPHPANANLRRKSRVMIDSINGVRIEKLEDVINAIEQCEDDWHTIRYAEPYDFDTLAREKADDAHPAILRTYRIANDRRL